MREGFLVRGKQRAGERCGWVRQDIRDRVATAATEHWPAGVRIKNRRYDRGDIAAEIKADFAFKRKIRALREDVGSIWAILLPIIIKMILSALIDLYFEEQKDEGKG